MDKKRTNKSRILIAKDSLVIDKPIIKDEDGLLSRVVCGHDIDNLEKSFESVKALNTPVRIDNASKIVEVEKFLISHFAILKGNSSEELKRPYLDRVLILKKYYEEN